MVHRALHIEDIVRRIVDELVVSDNNADGSIRRRTLVHLARTCKLLSPFALEIMWRNLPSLLPVLALLGPWQLELAARPEEWRLRPTVGTRQRLHDLEGLATSEGIATASRLSRLTQYASFVRILEINDLPIIAQDVFSELQTAGICPPLLPALQELRCTHSVFMATAAKWVVGPYTSTVNVNLASRLISLHELPSIAHDGPVSVNLFLCGLQTLAPRLTKLSLEDRHFKGYPCDVDPLLSLSGLQEIRCDVLCTTEFLRSLATFPCLRTLILHRVTGTPRSTQGGFARLERLEIHGSVNSNIHALETIKPSCLRILSINLYARHWDGDGGPPDMARHAGALSSVVQRCSKTLRDVDFNVDGESKLMESGYNSMADVWGPFLPAKDLCVFRLRVSHPSLPFPDTDLSALAGRWPGLHTLHIHSVYEGPHLPTVRGIADFADACPGLREISISHVDWPTSFEHAELFTAANNVRLLALGNWDGDRNARGADPRGIARYLNSRFPSLDLQGSKKLVQSLFLPKNKATRPCETHRDSKDGRFWGEILDSAEIYRFGVQARETGLWLPLKRRGTL